jgi:flagellar protein FlgJ
MRSLEEQQRGRVQVWLYTADFSSVVSEGWIPIADVERVEPPDRSVYTQEPPAVAASPFAGRTSFINAVGEIAQASRAKTGVPASVTVAQAILESDWGESLLARQAQNYFGIKAFGSIGSNGVVWMATHEFTDQGLLQLLEPFRAYKSLADSVADHDRLLQRSSRYRGALAVANDPPEYARRIASGGYSTDPEYASKVASLIERYGLTRFDS